MSSLCHAEELPIRLAHRVKELDELPHNLNKMPSIEKVKKWYAESFEVSWDIYHVLCHDSMLADPFLASLQELVNFPRPELPPHIHEAFLRANSETPLLPEAKPNPSLPEHMKPRPNQGKSMHGRQRAPLQHR